MATPQESMDTVLGELDRLLVSAYVAVDRTFAGAESSKLAALGALDADQARIARLRGELYDQVAAGSLSFERWLGIATTTKDDIRSQAADIEDWSLGNLLASTVAATGQDLKTGAVTLAKVASAGVGVGVVLLVAGYLLLPRLLRGRV